MAGRPERLARGIGVDAAESLLVDAALHQRPHALVGEVWLASALLRPAQHECELVDARIREAELHVGAARLPQELDRVAPPRRLGHLAQAVGKLLEALLDQGVEERVLVLEVQVEVAVRTADPLGELSHRYSLVAVANEGLSSRVEDLAPKQVPVPLTGGGRRRLTWHDHW